METNTKIILSLLILILLIVLPFFAVSFKLDLNKKELHVDRQRYEKVNRHCFEKKSSKSCLALLKQDLNILKAAHKCNNDIIKKPVPLTDVEGILRRLYKKQENSSNIEPEILLKTMLIKKLLLMDMQNPIESADFADKAENYIINNFSAQNRYVYVRVLQAQDDRMEKYADRINFKKNKRSLEEIIGR